MRSETCPTLRSQGLAMRVYTPLKYRALARCRSLMSLIRQFVDHLAASRRPGRAVVKRFFSKLSNCMKYLVRQRTPRLIRAIASIELSFGGRRNGFIFILPNLTDCRRGSRAPQHRKRGTRERVPAERWRRTRPAWAQLVSRRARIPNLGVRRLSPTRPNPLR